MDRQTPTALYRALREIYSALENGAVITFQRALPLLFHRYTTAAISSPTGFPFIDPHDDPYDQPYVPGEIFFKRLCLVKNCVHRFDRLSFDKQRFVFKQFKICLIGTTYVRRIFITPTRIILRSPELHTQNRILRHFDSDFAVRVSFRDDNFDKLTFAVFSMRTKGTFLEQIVGRHLRLGFIVSLSRSLDLKDSDE